MPIVDFSILDHFTRVVTWKVAETNDNLLKQIHPTKGQLEVYKSLTDKRKREFLGIRACLEVIGLNSNVQYHPNGKPYIEGPYNISLSHSHGMVTVGVSFFEIGVDIELRRDEKIINIQNKFIREDETFIYKSNKEELIDYLHIIWGIKESLYKIDKGNLWSFTNHYKVDPFKLIPEKPIICKVIIENQISTYYAHYKKIGKYYLTYVLNYI